MRAVKAQSGAAPCERPQLLLGLVGFTTDEEMRIRDAIARASPRQLVWRISTFGDADAWLVNGSRTQLLEDGDLGVASPAAGRDTVRFHLADIDRPIAFSEPVTSPDFEPTVTFSLHSIFTIQQVLARLSFWLRARAGQLWIAAQLVERESQLTPGGVYHVACAERLLAVVDRRGDVGVLPLASLLDFEEAAWHSRPISARYIPECFERISMSMLMWQYALRSQRDLLPQRYRHDVIHYRRPPKLEQRVVSDGHLRLLRELSGAPGRFDDLRERTGAAEAQLARDLAALYLVGAITTNPRRARVADAPLPTAEATASSLPHHSDWPSRPVLVPAVLKDTVPAQLARAAHA
jgi:hypothetical protein